MVMKRQLQKEMEERKVEMVVKEMVQNGSRDASQDRDAVDIVDEEKEEPIEEQEQEEGEDIQVEQQGEDDDGP